MIEIILNKGNGNLQIDEIKSSLADYTIRSGYDRCSNKTIAPNLSCQALIDFKPLSGGQKDAILSYYFYMQAVWQRLYNPTPNSRPNNNFPNYWCCIWYWPISCAPSCFTINKCAVIAF